MQTTDTSAKMTVPAVSELFAVGTTRNPTFAEITELKAVTLCACVNKSVVEAEPTRAEILRVFDVLGEKLPVE